MMAALANILTDLMKDSKPGLPSQAALKFLTHRNHEDSKLFL